MIDPGLRRRAESWRDADPDPDTVAEIERLLDVGDEEGLRARFDGALSFGTAGLRGPLGAGPNRMNRAVVRRTAAGLARWLDETGRSGPVVVGRDARHGSEAFADDTVAVLAAAGRPVVVFADPVPTPLVAFAARSLDAAGAVVVTASHNPPADNGYKVFGGGGAQILPAAADEIVASIDRAGPASSIVLARDSPLVTTAPHVVEDEYLAGVAGLRVATEVPAIRVVHTALHGVGSDLVGRSFRAAGFEPPTVVDVQSRPDPDFPTVAFPNPEEPGAMDLVLELAESTGADLALANDPDADRLAAAVPTVTGWRVLTGDEMGVLLADHLLRHGEGSDRFVATTVVSSSMLAEIAAAHGVDHVETLTGFKWLADAARNRPGQRLVLAYEEALGYSVGDLVRDKDGISAAVIFVELVAALLAVGSSVPDRLDHLARQHGVHHTVQWTARFDGTDGAVAMASRIDAFRLSPPATLGGHAVTEAEDLARGERLPPTDAVLLRAGPIRLIVRPSGTEPKLKVYVEVVQPVTDDVDAARSLAEDLAGGTLDDVRSYLA